MSNGFLGMDLRMRAFKNHGLENEGFEVEIFLPRGTLISRILFCHKDPKTRS